jgi:hypothetical protein
MAGSKGYGVSFILQVILVIAGVLVFTWFDPFDLLVPAKLTLRNTPVQVNSIKEIGQLITAEYYGEVISSSLEVKAQKQKKSAGDFKKNILKLHEDFISAVSEFSAADIQSRRRGSVYKAFVEAYPDLVLNPLYDVYLYYINEKLADNKYRFRELDKRLDIQGKEKLIKKLYKNRNKWRDKLEKLNTADITSLKEEQIKKQYKKEFRRSRLVMLGRGSVKAGFDFRDFSERNFRYDKLRNRIHFIGLQPRIISATINPWFIPEEGVEGFEFLIAQRHSRLDPKFTKEVKRLCLEKLRKQAMDKQILVMAKKNAESHLKEFFSLLLDKEVKSVTFHTDYLDYMYDVIAEDSVLSDYEIFTVDTVLAYFDRNYNKKNKYERMASFINDLQKLKHTFYGRKYTLGPHSSLILRITDDRSIDSLEVVKLREGMPLTHIDTIWYLSRDKKFDLSIKDKERLTEIAVTSDIETFCSDLKTIITDLEVHVDSTSLTDGKIIVSIGGKSCSINL